MAPSSTFMRLLMVSKRTLFFAVELSRTASGPTEDVFFRQDFSGLVVGLVGEPWSGLVGVSGWPALSSPLSMRVSSDACVAIPLGASHVLSSRTVNDEEEDGQEDNGEEDDGAGVPSDEMAD